MYAVARDNSLPNPKGLDANYISRYECGVFEPSPHHVHLLCLTFSLPSERLGLPGEAAPERPHAVSVLGLDNRALAGPIDQGFIELVHDNFFLLYGSEAYPEAYNLGIEILSRLTRGSADQIRWLNNTACAAVSTGMFATAAGLLETARREGVPTSDWGVLVESNLAYVRYHLGLPVTSLIPGVERAVRQLATSHLANDGWLQLWSRQLSDPAQVTPPFGVLLRLYARVGRYSEAFAAAMSDIATQGYRAQGTRCLLGMIGPIVGEERVALRHVNEIGEEHNPASSWDHMAAERDLIVSVLTGAGGPDDLSFVREADSAKGEYYSWATLADIRYFLAPDSVRDLRYELGRRTVSGYAQTSRANLGTIAQIKVMVK
jgi:hypothetical protein